MAFTRGENHFLESPKRQTLCSITCIFPVFASGKWIEYLFRICRSGKTAMFNLAMCLIPMLFCTFFSVWNYMYLRTNLYPNTMMNQGCYIFFSKNKSINLGACVSYFYKFLHKKALQKSLSKKLFLEMFNILYVCLPLFLPCWSMLKL